MIHRLTLTIDHPSEQDLHTLATFVKTRQEDAATRLDEESQAVQRVEVDTETMEPLVSDEHGFVVPITLFVTIQRAPF